LREPSFSINTRKLQSKRIPGGRKKAMKPKSPWQRRRPRGQRFAGPWIGTVEFRTVF
jgi:hypothetical protein